MKTVKGVFIACSVILVAVIIWTAGQSDYGSLKVEELKITNDAVDPFTSLRFEFRNDGQKEITRLRARINDIDLPYTFNVSIDNPILPSKSAEYHRYTAWYVPGGGVAGYVPVDGEWYKVTITIGFSDGIVETITKYDRFKERNIGSIASYGGFEMLFYDYADLLTYSSGSSLNFELRNVWYIEGVQTVDRIELVVDDMKIWDESVMIKTGDYFAVTVTTPTRFEVEQYHNVTLVAYSTKNKTSTYARRVLCQEK